MIPLIFLDTETTGLRPDIHAPWEVAWILATHDPESKVLSIYEAESHFVALESYPTMPELDPVALQVGRYKRSQGTWRLTAKGLRNRLLVATGAIEQIAGIGSPQVRLVGAVPSFDHAMLCSWVLGWPDFGEGLWHYHLIDVENLVAGRRRIPAPWNSQEMTKRYGLPAAEERHTALGDAWWALRSYAGAYGLSTVDLRPVNTYQEVAE